MAKGKKGAKRGKAPQKSTREEKSPKRRLFRRPPREPAEEPAVEARALARYVRLSPQKARLVMDMIRGRDAGEALTVLRFTKKRAAKHIEKVLRSAIANAEQKSETVDVDRLYVKQAVVNEGPRWKRMRPAPYGRAYIYQRRTSHIEIAVAERSAAALPPAAAQPAGRREATA